MSWLTSNDGWIELTEAELASCHDDMNFYKPVSFIDGIKETLFANSDKSFFVAELIALKGDMPKAISKQFFDKYDKLGFEFHDGSEIANECSNGRAILLMTK